MLAALLQPMANAAFRRLLLVFVLNGIASAIPATLVMFFMADVLQLGERAGLFLALYFISGAVGMPLWVWLSRRVGKRRAWLAGMILSIAAFVWAYGLGAGDAAAFGAVCVMSGVALGADLALPPAILADVMDQHPGGDAGGRGEGAYFGLWNLVTKLNLALAAGISLPLLGALGYVPGAPGGAAALSLAYCLIPCALKLLAVAALSFARLDPPPLAGA
jgi:Na+/melibiose symporter-like transporter